MDPHRIKVLDRTNHDDVVDTIPDNFELIFLPSNHGLINKHLSDRRGIKSFLHLMFEVFLIVGYPTTSSSESEGWSYNRRIPCVLNNVNRFLNCPCKTTTGHLKPNTLHRLGELLAIFSHLNGAIVCTDQLYTMFLKDT